VIDPLLQNASGKERTGMYMNPSLIIYLMRKWMPLKQEKIGIFGDINVDFKQEKIGIFGDQIEAKLFCKC